MRHFLLSVLIVLLSTSVALAQSDAKKEDTDASAGAVESQLKGVLHTAFAKIDPWRIKQAQHFTALREKKKEELGVNSPKDIYDALTPAAPEAPGAPTQGQQEEDLGDLQQQYRGVDILGYLVLLYAMALATIFSSIALFYITAVLLALLVLRFIVRLFR